MEQLEVARPELEELDERAEAWVLVVMTEAEAGETERPELLVEEEEVEGDELTEELEQVEMSEKAEQQQQQAWVCSVVEPGACDRGRGRREVLGWAVKAFSAGRV